MLLCTRSMIFVPPRCSNHFEDPRFNLSVLVVPLGFCAGLRSSTKPSQCWHLCRPSQQSSTTIYWEHWGFITHWYRICWSAGMSGMAITKELGDTSSARWMVSSFCKTTARTQSAALYSRWCEEGSAPSGSLLSWAVRKQHGHIFVS